MMGKTSVLRQHGVRGILSRIWTGEASGKSYTMSLTDPRLALIMQDYFADGEEKALKSPYRQLPVVYACIQAKARNIAKVPFVLKRIGDDEPLTDGPLVDLFARPNEITSGYDLWQAIVIALDTGGEFFLRPDAKTDRENVPVKLWIIPWQWVDAWKNGAGAWLGWTIRKGNHRENVAADEMIHGRYWHPEDELRGLAPIKALALPNAINWYSLRYSKLFFENDATPSVVIEAEKGLSDKQRADLKKELYEKRKGVDKSHGFLILGGATAKTLAPSNKDIQLLETMNASIDQVCMAFGVPKTELSLYGDVNRATAFTQDRGFWTKTLIPLMALIEGTLNPWLSRFGVYGMFDTGKVDALRYDLLEKVGAAVQLVSIGFTPNEVNERLDLGFEEKPWRDEPLTAGLLSSPEPDPEDDAKPDDAPSKNEQDATKGLDLSEALLAKKWSALDAQVLPIMSRAAARMRSYFADCERRLRSRISKHVAGAITKNVPPEDFEWVDEAFSDERLRKAMESIIEDSTSTGVASVGSEVGVRFRVPDTVAASAVRRRVAKLADINRTAAKQVQERLRDTLAKLIEEGATEQEAATRLLDEMRRAMRINMTRAKTIARTETHGAYSDGRWDAMHAAGVKRKRWISSRDAKVRDSHERYERRGPIGLDEEFGPGMKRPHDPSGDAGDVINCRCKCVAVIE